MVDGAIDGNAQEKGDRYKPQTFGLGQERKDPAEIISDGVHQAPPLLR